MGLTDTGLVTLLAIIAAGAVVVCIRLLPRYSRQVWGRVGLMVGAQLVLLVALLAVVNSSLRFYSSWADLFGADAGPARITDRSPASPPTKPSVRPSQDVLTQGLPVRQGRLRVLTVHGMRSGISARVYLYLPPQATHGHRPLPVVLVLAPARQMIVRERLPQVVAGQIAAGRLRPMLFVIAPPNRGCVDVPGGRQGETFFTQDLPTAIGTAYHVADAPGDWSVLGPNAAGYCAALLAMRHSDRFGSAAFSADALSPPGGDLYGGSPAIRDEYDPRWRLAHRPPPPISVGVVGDGGLLAHARPPMRAYWLPANAWRQGLPVVLRWLNTQLGAGMRS